MTTFYIVATPIGNLGDITIRAVKTLAEVDLILCEDSRLTKRLLDHYQIKTPTLSYHQHSKLKKIEYIINLLKEGKSLALVSDAGTPGISDPGNKLIKKAIESLGNKVKIVPIPGPSAVTAIASVSSLPTDKFLFLGFLPLKKKRKKFLEKIIKSEYPVIFYESPYRILKTLKELEKLTSERQEFNLQKKEIIIGRELTKKFETIYRAKTINQILEQIKKDKTKGEFVVVIG